MRSAKKACRYPGASKSHGMGGLRGRDALFSRLCWSEGANFTGSDSAMDEAEDTPPQGIGQSFLACVLRSSRSSSLISRSAVRAQRCASRPVPSRADAPYRREASTLGVPMHIVLKYAAADWYRRISLSLFLSATPSSMGLRPAVRARPRRLHKPVPAQRGSLGSPFVGEPRSSLSQKGNQL